MKTYLVGGAVRDGLLKRSVTERDWVVVGARPEIMLAKQFKPVGKGFPVFLHPQTKEEYALARTERKSGHGYHGFTFHAAPDVTLEDDLKRRDLTINAMAQDENGVLIDPYGGQADLEAKVLRHVSSAFAEDPVRVLRVARFAARFAHLGFSIAPETFALMSNMVKQGEVEYLVPDRVWQELDRALQEQSPQVFLQTLRACGALQVLFPELDNLYGVPNPEKWHPEIDTGIHTELVLQQAALLSTQGHVRFAALMHDVGKALTPPEVLPSHPGHGPKGVPLITAFCERYPVPKSYRELAVLVAQYHIDVHHCQEMTAGTLLNLLEKLDVLRRPGRFEEFITVCVADTRGRTGHEETEYVQAAYLQAAANVVAQVDTEGVFAQTDDGAKIKELLHQERARALRQFIKTID